MRKGRKLWLFFTAILLLLALPRAAFAAEGSFASAKKVSFGKNVSGSLTETSPERWYSFTLPSSGRTMLHASSYTQRTNYRICDPSGKEVWSKENVRKSSSTGKSRIDETIDLKSGTYYLSVDSKYFLINRYYGKFVFRIDYTAADESFPETNRKEEPGLADSPAVSFGKTIRGQIAANEDQDAFRFTVPGDGIVTLKAKAGMRYLWYNLYDANGSQLWTRHAVWDSKSGSSYFTVSLALRAGKYYLAAAKDRYTGPYAFRLTYKKVDVTFPETDEKQNGSTDTAVRITPGQTVRGLIALNNETDYYKFSLSSAKTLRVQAAAYTKYIAYTILNSRGETVWSSTPRSSATSGKSRVDETARFSKGTYYFVAKKVGNNTGRYIFQLS